MTTKEKLTEAFRTVGFVVKEGHKGKGYSENVLFIQDTDSRGVVALTFDGAGNISEVENFMIPGF